MNQKNTLSIYSDDGEKKDLFSYSARLQQFLEKYPTDKGWAIQTEETYMPETQPHVSVCFRAYLVNPEGKKLTSRSSFGPLQDIKSWQKIETNACSRLIAALGIGSEVFDEDEIIDLQEQGFSVKQNSTASLKAVPDENKDSESNQDSAPGVNEKPKVEPSSEPIKVPKTLLNNINRIAMKLDVEVPTFANKDEAQEFLKKLMEQINSSNQEDSSPAES